MEEYTMADALKEAYKSWREAFFESGAAVDRHLDKFNVWPDPQAIAMIAIAIYEAKNREVE